MTDVIIHDQGTLIGFAPVTHDAKEWFACNVCSEPWQWLGETLWVDHRYAKDLAIGLAEDGLTLGGH